MPAAGLPSLQLCGSAVCFFFHGLSLPISFAHIYLFFSIWPPQKESKLSVVQPVQMHND